MEWTGNIRKMRTTVLDGMANYVLPLYDVLEPAHEVHMNAYIGKHIRIQASGRIHCRVTGKLIKKTYGEGLSYPAFMDSPLATPSIIRPELSRIHEGIALRDEEWERANHLQPHITYLSLTSNVKVGVTRLTNVPSRWVDQGATKAIVLAETPYRQAAGLIEVALKGKLSDKTNWRNMLKGIVQGESDLLVFHTSMSTYIREQEPELAEFLSQDPKIHEIDFPVERYPVKLTSLKLDKFPDIEKKLAGIKGQYLIFSDDTVMNLRAHSAYEIKLSA